MLVRLNTSAAGDKFSLPFGTEIDSEELSALVGAGWENLCDPIEPAADDSAGNDGASGERRAPTGRRGRQK